MHAFGGLDDDMHELGSPYVVIFTITSPRCESRLLPYEVIKSVQMHKVKPYSWWVSEVRMKILFAS